jgi:hypothetical protein
LAGFHGNTARSYSQGRRRLAADALPDGDRRGLGGCAIGSINIDLFAKMTGLEFHVEGPVGLFALGRGADAAAPG